MTGVGCCRNLLDAVSFINQYTSTTFTSLTFTTSNNIILLTLLYAWIHLRLNLINLTLLLFENSCLIKAHLAWDVYLSIDIRPRNVGFCVQFLFFHTVHLKKSSWSLTKWVITKITLFDEIYKIIFDEMFYVFVLCILFCHSCSVFFW